MSDAPIQYSQKQRLLSIKTTLGESGLLIEKFSGREFVSAPFEFQCSLLSPIETVDMKALLRTPATISLNLPDGTDRPFHAIFRSLAQAEEGEGEEKERQSLGLTNPSRDLVVYKAVLVPQLWFLGLGADCKIFQEMSVPDIVEQVLTDAGVRDFQFRAPLRDKSRYPDREYCVQYRESSLNFISRLLEEEGIFYFFQHTDSKHTIVFADNSSILAPCPGQPSASYSFGQEGWVDSQQEGVINLERVEAAFSGKSALTDYFFEKPTLNLRSTLGGENEEVYDYPGKYTTLDDGDRYTRVRLEEHEASKFVVNGSSICRNFRPGYNFKLKNHYRPDTNQEYFLTSVIHTAFDSTYRQDQDATHSYKNQFQAIPKTVSFRPPRRARKPVVMGPQPALVVGKSGEEIWVDKYGRVKVQFYWDRVGKKNENSSCWVRVSQIWAGKNWGWMTIPRMGQEVIVDFLEGDPDRPIITGRVYNADQMPPYALPANQTQSGIKSRSSKGGGSANFNEIRFEDLKGTELLFIQAEKDMQTTVEHDDTQTIQNNRTIKVQGTHTENIVKDTAITIEQGNHSLTLNQGNQSITLTMGNQTTKLDAGAASTQAMQSITLTVGQNSIRIDQTGVTIKGLMVTIEGQTVTQVKGDVTLILKGGITMIN